MNQTPSSKLICMIINCKNTWATSIRQVVSVASVGIAIRIFFEGPLRSFFFSILFQKTFLAGRYKTWTLDWTMDWTMDWIMDSILDLILD